MSFYIYLGREQGLLMRVNLGIFWRPGRDLNWEVPPRLMLILIQVKFKLIHEKINLIFPSTNLFQEITLVNILLIITSYVTDVLTGIPGEVIFFDVGVPPGAPKNSTRWWVFQRGAWALTSSRWLQVTQQEAEWTLISASCPFQIFSFI